MVGLTQEVVEMLSGTKTQGKKMMRSKIKRFHYQAKEISPL